MPDPTPTPTAVIAAILAVMADVDKLVDATIFDAGRHWDECLTHLAVALDEARAALRVGEETVAENARPEKEEHYP
jgi:hypothetical protein